LRPAAVLCEICSCDGLNMATREELLQMAADYRLPIVMIDALVEYRRKEEASRQRAFAAAR
jgi:3,4-dihydroxy-2-butanone 4-phosphate synthase